MLVHRRRGPPWKFRFSSYTGKPTFYANKYIYLLEQYSDGGYWVGILCDEQGPTTSPSRATCVVNASHLVRPDYIDFTHGRYIFKRQGLEFPCSHPKKQPTSPTSEKSS